jgi:hypothetical protein
MGENGLFRLRAEKQLLTLLSFFTIVICEKPDHFFVNQYTHEGQRKIPFPITSDSPDTARYHLVKFLNIF